MDSAETHPQENARLAAQAEYQILNTLPEREFDDITHLAAFICGAPFALISLVDSNRHWFKSCHGIEFSDLKDIPREYNFCAHAMTESEPLVVEDATQDARFRKNPLVQGPVGIRFYAGAALRTPDGYPIGTICVLDRVPRPLKPEQKDALNRLATQVMTHLELRRSQWTLDQENKAKERALTDLRRQQALLSSVINHIPYYIFWKDRQSTYLGCNESFSHIARMRYPHEIVGKTDFDLPATPERARAFQMTDQEVMESGKARLDYEDTQMTPEGKVTQVLISKIPLKSDDGNVYGVLGIYTDITEFKLAQHKILQQQAKLVAASKMSALGEMAGGIAHEINNPLSVIYGRASQLKEKASRGSLDHPTTINYAEKIEATALRISRIVRALRSFARDAENDPFEKASLRSIFEDTSEFCSQRFRSHMIQLFIELPPPELELECRPTQISQVLLNLLNNSHDAVENLEEKWVRLSAQDDRDWIYISVTDSGTGIPVEMREKILEPFFTTKEINKGTGLGLSLSKGIIETHHGKLSLDARSPNTRFVISLPKTLSSKK